VLRYREREKSIAVAEAAALEGLNARRLVALHQEGSDDQLKRNHKPTFFPPFPSHQTPYVHREFEVRKANWEAAISKQEGSIRYWR